MSLPSAFPQALLGTGQVRHRRLRPQANRFAYPTYFLMLPMRQLRAQPSEGLRRNRWGLMSFFDADHGDGRSDSLAWLESVLATEGVQDAIGEVWLHCYPRVLGHTFKPVSFWYCHRADGGLAAVVVEVNNTFGERHCYFLQGPALAFGQEVEARKVFHVSPFCEVQGRYRFRFMRTFTGDAAGSGRTVVRIDHDDGQGPLLQTSVSGRVSPFTPQAARAAFFSMPLMTLGVVARIHWQALRLTLKRVPFLRKPPAPSHFITR
ncbi:MAG: DUF1365 domain-containing protein [Pseudomonadota bacterium]